MQLKGSPAPSVDSRIRRARFSLNLGEHSDLRRFEYRDDLLARHCWKTIQKVVYRVARLKVLEESLDGNTRATEHRRASHNLRRNRNQVVAHIRKRIGKGLLRQAWRLTACR